MEAHVLWPDVHWTLNWIVCLLTDGRRLDRRPARISPGCPTAANIPVACNRATADFLISSPLLAQAHLAGGDPLVVTEPVSAAREVA